MKKENELKKNLYDCFKCKDTYWIINENGKAKRCTCFKNYSIKEQWKASGLKLDDIDKTFSSFKHWNKTSKDMKTVATNYFLRFDKIKNSKQNSVLICGNPGSGKTHLSIALANNLINKGIKVVYMPYRDIVTSLKQSMLDKDSYIKEIRKYQNAEVLLIDDLFKGKITESDINIMFEIINSRYINKRPIIVSTEYLIKRLLEIDEAIGSRIFEMCKDFYFEVIGQENDYENNYRLQQGEN